MLVTCLNIFEEAFYHHAWIGVICKRSFLARSSVKPRHGWRLPAAGHVDSNKIVD